MASYTIAMIGAGNMGGSLVAGLINHGIAPHNIWVSDVNEEKLSSLHQQYNVHITIDNEKAIKAAEVIIFAIKPQFFKQILLSLAPILCARRPLIISIAAGIRTESMHHWLDANLSIIRAMPNTPALIGAGATALYADANVNEVDKQRASEIMGAVGLVLWVQQEKLMDVVTALSGSGPAYFFQMMESLQNAAVQLGLSEETAKLLTLQTGMGAIKMAMESGQSLNELCKAVTSPGGTTEQALAVLQEADLSTVFSKALQAAKKRSEELADQLGA